MLIYDIVLHDVLPQCVGVGKFLLTVNTAIIATFTVIVVSHVF